MNEIAGFKSNKIIDLILLCTIKVFKEYAGIYHIELFVILTFQPYYYYKLLFREQKTYSKLRITVITLITFILPLIIYFTLPNYTYREGKVLVEQYVQLRENLEFIYLSRESDTIPVINNPKQLFVTNREYYYVIKATPDNKYFVVCPITGHVWQSSENYWP